MNVTEAASRIADARAEAGRLLLALDFDGTLAPIVPRPEDAALLPASGRALGRLAGRGDTLVAIVSGRGLEDLRERVGQPGLVYAGNHGFEIEGPGVKHRLEQAEKLRPVMRALSDRLRTELAHVDGAEIEDKGITLSVHYRRVADAATAEQVRGAAEAEGQRAGLRVTHGKRVVELRPPIDWHKGRAVEFLLDTLADGTAPYPVFVGDDVTDEDAFRAVKARGGLAVLIAGPDEPRDTAADVRVDSPEALVALLETIAGADAGIGARAGR